MIKRIIITWLLFYSLLGTSQIKTDIVINHKMVEKYMNDFIYFGESNGFSTIDKVNSKVNYVLVMPEGYVVPDLGLYKDMSKIILLSYNVNIDRMVLKVVLYRELFHSLGVPYNKVSVIMNKVQEDGFSYVAFDDIDIMEDELLKLFREIK